MFHEKCPRAPFTLQTHFGAASPPPFGVNFGVNLEVKQFTRERDGRRLIA
jgi:hypothetical protein